MFDETVGVNHPARPVTRHRAARQPAASPLGWPASAIPNEIDAGGGNVWR